MRILSQYVFRQTAGALLLILMSLTGVTWIAVALRQLELVTSQGQDAFRFLAITGLAIPTMLAVIAPIALLIATIHVLNRLSGDSELIVMTSGGMPVWSRLKPLGLLALLVSIGVALVNHWIGPWSQRQLRELVTEVRTDLVTQVIQPWRFASPEARLTVHIRDRSTNGELLGLLMHDARDPKQVVTYLAERGSIIKQGGTAYLLMEGGHILRRLETDPTPQIVAFDRYAVDVNQLEQRADQAQSYRPRERYTSELLSPDPNDPVQQQSPGRYSSELHERFASPLYSFAFILLVVALMGQPHTTRQSRIQVAVAAFAIAVGCRMVGIGATNAAVLNPLAVAMQYAVPIAACAVAALVARWQSYPRAPSKLMLAMGALARRAAAIPAILRPGTLRAGHQLR